VDKFFCQIKFGAFCGRFLYGFVKKTQNPLQILQKTNTFFNKLIKNNMTFFGTVFVFAILAIVGKLLKCQIQFLKPVHPMPVIQFL
jgi:hypothetical protein